MNWIALTLIAAAMGGAGNVVEKQLASRYLPSASALMGWLGLTLLGYGVIFAFIYPFAPGTSVSHIAAIFVAGALYGVSLSILYRVLKKAEASRAFPVYNAAPVFVAILSVFVLGNPLSAWQWVAVLVTVLGAVVISAERGSGVLGFSLNSNFFVLLLAAAIVGGAHVLTSYAMDEMEPMTAFWAMRLGCFALVLVNWRKDTAGQILESARKPVVLLLVLVFEAGLMPLAHVFMMRAFATGPVALVSTLFSSVPIWVLLISTLLSSSWFKVMDEPVQKRALALKVVAIAMVVGGVALITLL